MKPLRLALLLVPAAFLCSCSSTVDEYNYGYAPAYRTLPDNFQQATINGESYWHHGGRFYVEDGTNGYLLVKPPRGSEAIVAAAAGGTPAPTGTPVAGKPDRGSWLSPGDGTLRLSDKPRAIGRSPVRMRRPVRD